jgi:large subunit ribosomal protein L18
MKEAELYEINYTKIGQCINDVMMRILNKKTKNPKSVYHYEGIEFKVIFANHTKEIYNAITTSGGYYVDDEGQNIIVIHNSQDWKARRIFKILAHEFLHMIFSEVLNYQGNEEEVRIRIMLTKKEQRLRRARQTRIRIAQQGAVRLTVNRTNLHIYANVISADGARILASASTAEAEVRSELGAAGKGGNAAAAAFVGKRIAEKAKAAGIEKVAFDRSGFAYHGRVKALAEAAREAGLQF